jgi:hypothetical protein
MMASRDIQLDIVKAAFFASHDGVSTDELLCDDVKLAVFDTVVQQQARTAGFSITVAEARHLLLNIRKSGKLGPVVDKRYRGNHDPYKYVAETAARITEDRHRTTVDRILCDPVMRSDFDDVAGQFRNAATAKDIRLAAMSLRKAKQLPPLLAQKLLPPSRIIRLSVVEIRADGSRVPRAPGTYVFGTSSQCLYVGEADDLHRRVVKEHCVHSDRQQLAQHLWQHGPDDVFVEIRSYEGVEDVKRKPIRRALESELIETRRPAFNIQGR